MQRTMQHSSDSAQMATRTMPTMMAILIHFFCVYSHNMPKGQEAYTQPQLLPQPRVTSVTEAVCWLGSV